MIEEEIVPKQDIVVNIALKILIQEYKNYIQKRNTVRKNLATSNKNIINVLKHKKKKIYFDEKEVNLMRSKAININFNKLNSLAIPRGIYIFPAIKSFRVESEHEMKYMYKFESFKQYENVIAEVSDSIQEWFTEFPRNKGEDERLLNSELIVISCIKTISLLHENDHKFTMIGVIEAIASLIKKKASAVYQVVSKFFRIFIKKHQRNTYNLNESIKVFRNYFCNICFKYNCNIHFFNIDNIVQEGTGIKILKRNRIKNSLSLEFSNDLNKKNCNEIDYDKLIKCKNCRINDQIMKKEVFAIEIYVMKLFFEIFKSNCLISKLLFPGVSCLDISSIREKLKNNLYKQFACNDSHVLKSNIVDINKIKSVTNKNYLNYLDFPEYEPCSHPGNCRKDNCRCIRTIGLCEIFCNCRDYCNKQFEGCECTENCLKDCPCFKSGRECDPDICRHCYYDFNKYNIHKNRVKKIRSLIVKHNLCKNMYITLNLSLKTVLGKSSICDGLGLFTLEDIEKDEFICEYTGEIISRDESDRRSVIKDQIGLNYLFTVSQQYDIDAYRSGNEMRYVNHSDYGYENCHCKKMYVRCIYRIALFANRKINALEELYFNYCIKLNLPWLHKYNKYYKNDINTINIPN